MKGDIMEKPISLVIRDLKLDLAAAINRSNLHPSVTLPILEEFTDKIREAVVQAEQKDETAYKQALADEEKEGSQK